jgi:tetratricopeptide (TPR) repeat protein
MGQQADDAVRGQARRHYLAAGEHFLKHARRVVVEDPTLASQSVFNAGDCYDLGGDLATAIKVLGEYLQGAGDDEADQPHAKFRLAQALEATGEFGAAAALYRELVEGRGVPGERSTAVLWADRSVAPLARCLLTDADPANDAEAEQHLLSVVEGRNLEPEAQEFRDAIVELGRLYYAGGRYAESMQRFGEAVERFPDDPEIETLRFKLADSARLSAAEIDRVLLEAMPQAQRQELERARVERRQQALRLFQQVKAALSRRPAESLTETERLYLRNTDFYLGDCAFDLGDYEGAIAAYDTARQKYAGDPAALVAMVQIVNAYVRMGEWSKAATANERARQQLARYPDEVWSAPNLPMERKHWERWLDSRVLLEQRVEAGGG